MSFRKPSALTLYDKRADLNDKKKPQEYGGAPHTRIEVRRQANSFVSGLGKFKADLDAWMIVRTGMDDSAEEREQRRILDSIRVRGFPRAGDLHDGNGPRSPEDMATLFQNDVIAADFNQQIKAAMSSGVMGQIVEWGATDVALLM